MGGEVGLDLGNRVRVKGLGQDWARGAIGPKAKTKTKIKLLLIIIKDNDSNNNNKKTWNKNQTMRLTQNRVNNYNT